MKLPLVSVIIPTFNRGYCISRAIKSVLTQSYKNLEVLICDDGSTDNTYKIVSSIKDKRVKWLPGYHSGLPAVPRNNGLKESNGEYIAFLDSDDLWVKDKLRIQVAYLLSNPTVLACSTNAFINASAKSYLRVRRDKKVLDTKKLMINNEVITSTIICHKSVFDISKGFVEKKNMIGYEDYEKWLKVSAVSDIHLINIPLAIYKKDSIDSIRNLNKSNIKTKNIAFFNMLFFLFFYNFFSFICCTFMIIGINFYLFLKRVIKLLFRY